ncbi:MAG: MFS transporter [Cyclobacteriaceae bacterium]
MVNELRKRRLSAGVFFFLAGFCFSSWASRIPDFQREFSLSEGQLGSLLLGMPLGSLLALPLAAWAVFRFGSKVVVLIGMAFYIVALILIGLSTSVFILAVMVFVFGMLGNVMNISLNTQAVHIEKDYKRNILSSFHGLWSLAGFFGAGLGALMVYIGISPGIHYFLVMIMGLGIIIFAKSGLVKEASGKESAGGGLFFKRPGGVILKLGMVGFCGMMCEGCLFDWSGVYMATVALAPPHLVPAGYVAYMGAMAMGRFIADKLANKWGKVPVIQTSGAMIFLGLIAAVIWPSFWVVIIGFLLVGFGTASVVPLTYSMAGLSKDYAPGIAIAMVSTISFFGFLLGPPIIGFVAELLDLRSSFALMSIVGLMVSVWVTIGKKSFK